MTGTGATSKRRRRLIAVVVAVSLGLALLPIALVGLRSREVSSLASSLSATVDRMRQDASALDLAAVAGDLTTLQDQAASLHSATDDQVWGLATALPIVGDRATAARQLGAVADNLASAAAPLAALLPRFDPAAFRAAGGKIDLDALTALGPVLDALSTAVDQSTTALTVIDRAGLTEAQADQVTKLQAALVSSAPAVRSAASLVPLAASLLGAHGTRAWFVALENLTEARGTGGFVGAYAVLRTEAGRISLLKAGPDNDLVSGPPIPIGNLPQEFQQLWGRDAADWAGLNLSPHFPYTGQLIVDGWKARGGAPLDGVIALDQTVVAALLAGTGPVTVRGVTLDSANAFTFLTKDIYARFPNVAEKNAVVTELVTTVFARLSAGKVSLPALLDALRGPVSEGRFLVYSTHPDEQEQLAEHVVAGILPDTPGPFAMAVINNGAGNKLDTYTSVHVDYRQGSCFGSIRTSTVHVTLHNGAPKSGLPRYVRGRLDLPANLQARAPQGSTKLLLYVYGPFDSSNGLTTLDGQQVPVAEGLERGHTVWRVDVVLNPGQTRTVDVQMVENVDPAAPVVSPVVGVQPMAIPQVVRAEAGPPCSAG